MSVTQCYPIGTVKSETVTWYGEFIIRECELTENGQLVDGRQVLIVGNIEAPGGVIMPGSADLALNLAGRMAQAVPGAIVARVWPQV